MVSNRGIVACTSSLRASQPGLRPSQPVEPVAQALLLFGLLRFRPDWLGLRGTEGGHRQTNVQTNGNSPHSKGLCPLAGQLPYFLPYTHIFEQTCSLVSSMPLLCCVGFLDLQTRSIIISISRRALLLLLLLLLFLSLLFLPVYLASVSLIISHAALLYLYFSFSFIFCKKVIGD